MSEVPRPKMPRLVILESTALFQLGSLFEQVDFENLLQLKRLLKFDIAVSQVSWLEFLRKRKTQVSECLGRIKQLRSSLDKLGQESDAVKPIEDRLVDLAKNLPHVFEAKLAELGIQTIPLAKPDVEHLLQMSMDNVPPFEESHEKGFRDSLIMFSILAAIKDRPEINAMLVSDDKLLAEAIQSRQNGYGTSVMVVEQIGDALKHILTLVDAALREKRAEERQEARELLLKYRSDLEKAVEKIREFSHFELIGLGGLGGRTDLGGTFERVVSIIFKDVDSATWKTRTENDATVLFSLKYELTLLVGPNFFSGLNLRYQVGGGQVMKTVDRGKPEEKTIEKSLFGVAEFTKKNGEFQLVRLSTDQDLPIEDMVTLMKPEMANS